MSAGLPQGSDGSEGAPTGIGGGLRRLTSGGDLSQRRVTALQLTPVVLFLAIFLVAPLLLFAAYSLWETQNFEFVRSWNFNQYTDVLSSDVELTLIKNTIVTAALTGVVVVFVAYVYAHMIRFHLRRWQEPLLLLVLVALFSGYLVRVYAWRTILGDEGVINQALLSIGIIDEPLTFLLFSRPAIVIVLANFLIPLAILPIYAALQDVGDDEVESARDLGCGPFEAMWKVTLPLARRGVFVAFALSFIITAGDYITPQLVGGTEGSLIGRAIQDQFLAAFDWPRGAALSFITLAITLAILAAVWRLMKVVWR